jgi:Domain of unknown function (DUF4884)
MRTLFTFTLFLSMLAGSCAWQRPIRRDIPKNNDTYRVEYLFEHEGCKVYRFLDRGNPVYFTNCNGSTFFRPDSSTTIQNVIIKKN